MAAASSNRQSPLEKEVSFYTSYIIDRGKVVCNATSSLEFWGNDGMVIFPILASIAARVLSISERLHQWNSCFQFQEESLQPPEFN